MKNNRWTLFIILIFLLLIGCTSKESEALTPNTQMIQEDFNLNEQVEEDIKPPDETFMMDLRETLNLSFKILQAMENNDYTYLKVVSASGITIDQEKNQVVYTYSGEEIRCDFLKGINFSNLEYWGSGYTENYSDFQIVFAQFLKDTHGTIYFDFIKEGNQWLFNGFITNA